LAYVDLGHQTVWHIEEPIRVYKIASLGREQSGPSGQDPTTTKLPLPTKPFIAVLPFANMSGDPEQEYFADGSLPHFPRYAGCSSSRRESSLSFEYDGDAAHNEMTMSMIFPNETPAYREARRELLAREVALRREMETVAAEIRALPPGGEIPED
jgi:hypothetical protein